MADKTFLDWPFFDQRHRALAEEVEAWASANVERIETVAGANVDGACRELVSGLGEAGICRHAIPGDDGSTLDVRSLCVVRETLAQRSGLADFAFAMQGLGSGPISLAGTPEQRAQYLPAVSRGENIAAFALSEAKSGSDVANLEMSAANDGDGYVLNGEKTFISNGGIADFYTVFARTGESDGAKGISAFIVDADNPGLIIAERINTIAPHPLARLKFENCRVGAEALLGTPGKGFALAMAVLDIFRSSVGAAALGFARRAQDEAVARAKSRELFGAPMGDLQMVQGMIAESALDIDASALLIYRAAWVKDTTGARISREASMAKLYATEAAQKVIDRSVQIFGGQGVVSGETVERLYREIRSLRIYEGASEVQKLVIARQVLGS